MRFGDYDAWKLDTPPRYEPEPDADRTEETPVEAEAHGPAQGHDG